MHRFLLVSLIALFATACQTALETPEASDTSSVDTDVSGTRLATQEDLRRSSVEFRFQKRSMLSRRRLRASKPTFDEALPNDLG